MKGAYLGPKFSDKHIESQLDKFKCKYDKKTTKEITSIVAKELSKAHENYFRGTAREILDKFKANSQLVRGEFVLLIYFEKRGYDYAIADKLFKKLESKVAIGELSKLASDLTGINKNLLYKRFLSFSQKS